MKNEFLELDLDEELEQYINSVIATEGSLFDSVLSESATTGFDLDLLDTASEPAEYVPESVSGSAAAVAEYIPTPVDVLQGRSHQWPPKEAVPTVTPMDLPTLDPTKWDGGSLWDPSAVEVERNKTTISVRAFGITVHVPTRHVLRYRKWKSWGPGGKILLRWTPTLELKSARLIVKQRKPL